MARYEASTSYCQDLSNDVPWSWLAGAGQHAPGTDPASSLLLFPFETLFGMQDPPQGQTWPWLFYPLNETCKKSSCQILGLVLSLKNLYVLKG